MCLLCACAVCELVVLAVGMGYLCFGCDVVWVGLVLGFLGFWICRLWFRFGIIRRLDLVLTSGWVEWF